MVNTKIMLTFNWVVDRSVGRLVSRVSEKEIGLLIGADKLIYQDLTDLISSVKNKDSLIDGFDSSCFDGKYVTGGVTDEYLKELDELRNNAAKNKDIPDSNDDVMVY